MEAPAPPPVKNGDVGDWRLSDADFLASFHLPGLSDKHDRLQEQHPLPRDHRIVFHEAKHEYFCDGVKAPRSVTGYQANNEFPTASRVVSLSYAFVALQR